MSGDGRWDVEWKFVKCPGEEVDFAFEKKEKWYWKIQPQGTETPVKELTVNGVGSTKTDDNFFEPDGAAYPLDGKQSVKITTIDGFAKTYEE